jgi:hypothetical protein
MIGIGITTCGRRDVLNYTLEYHRKFLPDSAKIFISEDCSESGGELVRGVHYYTYHHSKLGIGANKNHLFDVMKGCDHIFQFDDDCYPIKEGWHLKFLHAHRVHPKQKVILYMSGEHERLAEYEKLDKYIRSSGVFQSMTKPFKAPNLTWLMDITWYRNMKKYGLIPMGFVTIKNASDYLRAFDIDGVPDDFNGKFTSTHFKPPIPA